MPYWRTDVAEDRLVLQLMTANTQKGIIYCSTSLEYSPIFLRRRAAPYNATWEIVDNLENGKILASSLDTRHPPSLWNVSKEDRWKTISIYFICVSKCIRNARKIKARDIIKTYYINCNWIQILTEIANMLHLYICVCVLARPCARTRARVSVCVCMCVYPGNRKNK